MSLPRRVLIAVTSAHAKLFDGPTKGVKEDTGLFISEALHPFNVFTAAGYEVDLSSETGTYTPEWLSLQPDYLSGDDLTTWNTADSAFRKKLDNMPKAAELDPSKYGIFFASAGYPALIDYPHAKSLQNVAEQVWAKGGIVSSVCHGPAIFAHVRDLATGEPLIKGKSIAGYCTEAEEMMGFMDILRGWGEPLVEEWAAKLGATCKCL
jgi:putative intracellular protease/amidase